MIVGRKHNVKSGKHYPKSINKLLSKKRILWKSWQKTNSTLTKARYYIIIIIIILLYIIIILYRQVATECRKAIIEHCASLELKVVRSNKLGQIHKYANRKMSSKSGVGVIKTVSGDFVSDPVGQANIFNDFFAASFVVDNNYCPPFASRVAPEVGLANIEFAERTVFMKLAKLRTNSAGGPDMLSPLFLNKVSGFIASPLAFMFEEFFRNSFVPPVWRTAFVRPISKS